MSRDNAMPQAHTDTTYQATDIGEAPRSEQTANTELAISQHPQASADNGMTKQAHSTTEEPIAACVSQLIESIEEKDNKTAREEEMQSSPPPIKSSSSSNEETCVMCCVPLDDNTGICDECQDKVAVDMSDIEYRTGAPFGSLTNQVNKSTRSPNQLPSQHNTVTGSRAST